MLLLNLFFLVSLTTASKRSEWLDESSGDYYEDLVIVDGVKKEELK